MTEDKEERTSRLDVVTFAGTKLSSPNFLMCPLESPKDYVIQGHGAADETCQTYVLHKEDHTLGNSLRYMIMKNPDVQFCGYSIPHPSEHKMNLRIQTNGVQADSVLKKGLTDLHQVCEHVLKTFEKSATKFKKQGYNLDS